MPTFFSRNKKDDQPDESGGVDGHSHANGNGQQQNQGQDQEQEREEYEEQQPDEHTQLLQSPNYLSPDDPEVCTENSLYPLTNFHCLPH